MGQGRVGSIVTKQEDYMFSSSARHEAAIRRLSGMRWADDLHGHSGIQGMEYDQPSLLARLFRRLG